MVPSPFIGLVLGFLVMCAILWLFRRTSPGRVSRGFRLAQSVSAAPMSLGHGMQDAAKTMGVVVLALNVGGYHEGTDIPIWVFFLSATVLAGGTYSRGWALMRTPGGRIIRPLGRRIIELAPPRGFAAESTASSMLFVAAIQFGAPISTTHTITSAIMGVGATRGRRAVRWGVASNI